METKRLNINEHKPVSYHQVGATLLELVVALFIFAIGVLGLASLQLRAVQATFDNSQRDQVVWLTQSLIDRMKLNSSEAASLQYQSVLDGSVFNEVRCQSFNPSRCASTQSEQPLVCSSEQMVVFDIVDNYCANNFQGATAVKQLSVNLSCVGACSGLTSLLRVRSQWCARSVESESGLSTTDSESCNNAAAKMSYTVDFRL